MSEILIRISVFVAYLLFFFPALAIVNGKDVTSKDWKNKTVESVVVQVSIELEPREYQARYKESKICTGVILNQRLVMTAAHCMSKGSTVRVYQTRSVDQGESYPVERILKMTGSQEVSDFFDQKSRQADIAILVLREPLRGSFQNVVLPRTTQLHPSSQGLFVIGYGRSSLTRKNLNSPDYKLRKGVTDQFTVLDQVITVDPSNGRPGVCEGDSGGPLLESLQSGDFLLWGTAVSVGSSPGTAGLVSEEKQRQKVSTPQEIFKKNPKLDLCKRSSFYLKTQVILPWINKVIAMYP